MSGLTKKIVLWLMVACVWGSVMLAGCHTMKGAGEDIEQGGKAVQRATD
jgi:predicted small secreted protein